MRKGHYVTESNRTRKKNQTTRTKPRKNQNKNNIHFDYYRHSRRWLNKNSGSKDRLLARIINKMKSK